MFGSSCGMSLPLEQRKWIYWLADMEDMVNNLRQVEGFENIIIVPGNEQGQSEDVLLANGNVLMSGRFNLLFDLHAYEKWLLDQTEEDLVARIQTIRNAGIPFIIGEVGVQNVGEIMHVQPFLNAAQNTQLTTLALNSSDNNALLTDEGTANATATNNFGAQHFRHFSTTELIFERSHFLVNFNP